MNKLINFIKLNLINLIAAILCLGESFFLHNIEMSLRIILFILGLINLLIFIKVVYNKVRN